MNKKKICSLTGHVLKSGRNDESKFLLEVRDFLEGTYIFQLECGALTIAKKLMIGN